LWLSDPSYSQSANARCLARRRTGFSLPLNGPAILVPGLHWDGITVLGMDGPPTLAHMQWWTTRGEHATTQRTIEQRRLSRCAAAWGRRVRHVWNRGDAGAPWVQAALTADVGFIVRWKQGNTLLDNWGEGRKAWEIARGKRCRATAHQAADQGRPGGVPVMLLDHPQPLCWWWCGWAAGGSRGSC
jgi:hypothetical protein